jgi:hypothetical protein
MKKKILLGKNAITLSLDLDPELDPGPDSSKR